MKEARLHVWLAAASLHEAGYETFDREQLLAEVRRLFEDTRPAVGAFSTSHANASAPKSAGTVYNYLVRVNPGKLRLCRVGDVVHPSRAGAPLWPDQAEIDPDYWPLWRKWSAWQGGGREELG